MRGAISSCIKSDNQVARAITHSCRSKETNRTSALCQIETIRGLDEAEKVGREIVVIIIQRNVLGFYAAKIPPNYAYQCHFLNALR